MHKNDIFDELDPKDGFAVDLVEHGSFSVSLYAGLRRGGVFVQTFDNTPEESTVQIAAWENPTPADCGACSRLCLVMQAVARYLTTGGNWPELLETINKSSKVFRGGMEFPGYYYLEGYLNNEGDYEHIFVKDGTEEGVLWVENGFIQKKSLSEIRREQEDNEWEDADDEDDSGADLEQLPYRPDHRSSQHPGDGAADRVDQSDN